MKKYYSNFYKNNIEVENINWEILVNIFTKNNEKIIYSWYDLEDKTSYSPYIKNALLASFINKIPEKILILWFWAWSFAKYFEDYLWKKIKITWVELDNTMLKIAKNELKIKSKNLINIDYIEYLNKKTPNLLSGSIEIEKQNKNSPIIPFNKGDEDIIFFDIYDKNSQIPKSFNKLEILKKIKNLLDKNWLFIVNFANYLENLDYYKKIEQKIISVFWENFIKIKSEENIVWVFWLEKILNSEELILKYLEKIKKNNINYDSNLIKNIILV